MFLFDGLFGGKVIERPQHLIWEEMDEPKEILFWLNKLGSSSLLCRKVSTAATELKWGKASLNYLL